MPKCAALFQPHRPVFEYGSVGDAEAVYSNNTPQGIHAGPDAPGMALYSLPLFYRYLSLRQMFGV